MSGQGGDVRGGREELSPIGCSSGRGLEQKGQRRYDTGWQCSSGLSIEFWGCEPQTNMSSTRDAETAGWIPGSIQQAQETVVRYDCTRDPALGKAKNALLGRSHSSLFQEARSSHLQPYHIEPSCPLMQTCFHRTLGFYRGIPLELFFHLGSMRSLRFGRAKTDIIRPVASTVICRGGGHAEGLGNK